MDKMCPFMNRSCTRYCALANAREYKDWQNQLIISNRRVSYYSNLKDAWKTYTKHITELSQNMRTELMTLRVEDRANKDLQKEKFIRHVNNRNYEDEYYDDESEVGAEPTETHTVKKVKKVVKE